MSTFLVLTTFAFSAWTPMSSWFSMPVPNIEICDNARDDDGDGWIDLNDPDCDCPPPLPKSLIPNPSFEEKDCCPGNSAQMYCATGWIQASVPTTDYLNTCGWLGWEEYLPPLPFPDGDGCIGFRDGRPGANGNGPQSQWKEYIGACLDAPMKIGKIYRIEFHLGFSRPLNSPPINVAFYGAESCSNLPVDEDDAEYGCPTNDVHRGWKELGKVRVSGNHNWQQAMIEFSPSRDIEAIVIGPDCERRPSQDGLYYFLDNLILAEREEFDFDIRPFGNPCTGTAVLEIPEREGFSYQWYRDGIALVGATDYRLAGPLEEGRYQVRLSGPNGCGLTDAYTFRVPITRTVQEERICAGDQYPFNGLLLTKSGKYLDTLKTTRGCDSIVELRLSVRDAAVDTVHAKIFDSEAWQLGNHRFRQPGEYSLTLQSSDYCDSLVHLVLDRYQAYIPNAFSPNGDGVNDFFTIYGSEEVKEVAELLVFNRWGTQVFAAQGIAPGDGWDGRHRGQFAPSGVYVYLARIIFDDDKPRVVKGTVMLIR